MLQNSKSQRRETLKNLLLPSYMGRPDIHITTMKEEFSFIDNAYLTI